MANSNIEFRYYDMPAGQYILPKIGRGWEFVYGRDIPEGQLHFHNYMEIGYCYHGQGDLVIQDRRYRFDNDVFTIIPANIPHTTVSDEENVARWEFLFVDSDSFIRNEMKNCSIPAGEILRTVNSRGTMKTLANHRELGMLVRMIIEECRNEDSMYREVLKGYLYSLMIGILRLEEEREQFRKNGTYNRFVEKSTRYIEEHYREDLRIADIADVCGLSESHFRRVFTASMNMKPGDYLNMVRVSKACEILSKQDVSMAEAGSLAGYDTVSSFNRNFRKLTGMSPMQYRKKCLREGGNVMKFHVSAKKGWEARITRDDTGVETGGEPEDPEEQEDAEKPEGQAAVHHKEN